jgi:hypothetical protein
MALLDMPLKLTIPVTHCRITMEEGFLLQMEQ